MTWYLFLDESGDLGFDFSNKRPSQFLTIAILAVSDPPVAKAIRGAVKKTLKRKVNGSKTRRKHPRRELKGENTGIEVKKHFYNQIEDLKFGIYALSLMKERVHDELCDTPEAKDRLYNYVARQVIDAIPFELATGAVELIVDRSKNKKGVAHFNSYVISQLQGRIHPLASLQIRHQYSHEDLGLSAADLFCWGIFRRRESLDEEWYHLYQDKILADNQFL